MLVNAIAPGIFVTGMSHGPLRLAGGGDLFAARPPNRRLGMPEDITGVIAWLASRAGSHCNGIVVPLDGGAHLARL